MKNYEIVRNYGLFDVYENEVFVKQFIALWLAKEFIASKIGA